MNATEIQRGRRIRRSADRRRSVQDEAICKQFGVRNMVKHKEIDKEPLRKVLKPYKIMLLQKEIDRLIHRRKHWKNSSDLAYINSKIILLESKLGKQHGQ